MASETTPARREALSQRRRLGILLGLNALMIVALVIVGFSAHSLGVLAAGVDYAADSAAILLGIIAVTTVWPSSCSASARGPRTWPS